MAKFDKKSSNLNRDKNTLLNAKNPTKLALPARSLTPVLIKNKKMDTRN